MDVKALLPGGGGDSKIAGLLRKVRQIPDFSRNPFRMGGRVTLGIDFGTQSIKLVVLRRRGKTIDSVSARVIRRPTADVGKQGRIEETIPLIKEAVRAVRDEINTVVVSVQGPSVVVRRVDIPPIPKNELKSAIPWVIDKFLPFSIENAIFDYLVLDEKGSRGEMALLIAVVEKEWIHRLMSQLKKIGLPPSSITIAPIALENLVQLLGVEKDQYNVAINIGERVTSINFYLGSQIVFSRDIMTAGDSITSSLTGKVTYKGEEFTIDTRMAEEIKCKYGIPMGELPEFTDNGIPFSSIQALMRPTIERLTAEVDRSLKYADRNYGIGDINRVMLTGGSAKLLNLKESLEAVLGTTVEILDPTRAIDPIRELLEKKCPPVFRKFGTSLSVAIGLALEKGDGLNLVSSGVQDLRKTSLEKKIIRMAASLLFLVLAGTSLNLSVKERISGKKLATAYSMLESIENDPSHEDVRTIQDRIVDAEALLKKFTMDREFTPLLLKDISHRLPDGVILSNLTLIRKRVPKDPNGDPGVSGIPDVPPGEETEPKYAGWELALEGLITYPKALSEPVLTVIMLDLESSPFLTSPELVSLDVAEGEEFEAMEFYIKCDVIRSGTANPKYL